MFYILHHAQSIVCATVDRQWLEYSGHITLHLVGHQSDSFYYLASHSYSPEEKIKKISLVILK